LSRSRVWAFLWRFHRVVSATAVNMSVKPRTMALDRNVRLSLILKVGQFFNYLIFVTGELGQSLWVRVHQKSSWTVTVFAAMLGPHFAEGYRSSPCNLREFLVEKIS
jgi:hypothetical protein